MIEVNRFLLIKKLKNVPESSLIQCVANVMVWQPETLKDEKQKTLATMGRGKEISNFHQAPMGGDQVEQHVYVEQGGLETVQV